MPNDRQTVTLTTDWMNKNYYMSAISQTDLPDIYLIGDHYVAQLKGVLRNISQNIEIVDISHSVQAFNVTQAAFVLGNAYKYFPDGTIHLVGVNSEPSPKNRLVAIEKDKHYFVGANNGIFNMMFDTPPDVAYELTPPENLQGFAALAVFAVAVNHIINKRDISLLGQPIDVNIKEIIRPTYSDSSITGSVLFIDHFGNLITNIEQDLFSSIRNLKQNLYRSFSITVNNIRISRISSYYDDVNEYAYLALFNSTNTLEIAMRNGNLALLHGIDRMSKVRIEFNKANTLF